MVSTAMDLFKDPFFIGINRELDRFSRVYGDATKQTYPPYDLIQIDDDDYLLKMAVAGFSKDDIEITVNNGTLTISGKTDGEINDYITKNYLHRGIAMRKFTRTFALGEYMEVVSAEMKDGLLYVAVKREIPEEKRPKQITIK
jgi:molecular chaperone IbpA